LKKNLLKVICMLREIIFTFFFVCASFSASAAVKEDLTSLYASALNNNWKRVTAKTEIIIADYEKKADIIRTQKQLTELEKFVVMNNLNPVKTNSFLRELRSVKASLTNSIPKKKKMQPTVINQVVVIEKASSPQKNFFNVWMGILGIFLVGILGTWKLIKRQQQHKPKKPVFTFESELCQRDLDFWKKVSPALVSQQKGLGEASVFSNESLFALEFDYTETDSENDLANLKILMSGLNAQLLLQSEWSSEQKFSRKLILNFPIESVA